MVDGWNYHALGSDKLSSRKLKSWDWAFWIKSTSAVQQLQGSGVGRRKHDGMCLRLRNFLDQSERNVTRDFATFFFGDLVNSR
jgi:hypothetical protein